MSPSASTRKRSRPERSEQPYFPIHVEGPRVNYEKLATKRQGEPSAAVRERVSAARLRQSERFHGTRLLTNADMGPAQVRRYCQLDAAGQRLMQAACRSYTFRRGRITACSSSLATSPIWLGGGDWPGAPGRDHTVSIQKGGVRLDVRYQSSVESGGGWVAY
jgi:Magnesium chelatase, subunit ChlI C-terminal